MQEMKPCIAPFLKVDINEVKKFSHLGGFGFRYLHRFQICVLVVSVTEIKNYLNYYKFSYILVILSKLVDLWSLLYLSFNMSAAIAAFLELQA